MSSDGHSVVLTIVHRLDNDKHLLKLGPDESGREGRPVKVLLKEDNRDNVIANVTLSWKSVVQKVDN